MTELHQKLQDTAGPLNTRVTGEPRSMSPLEYVRANKESVRQLRTRARLVSMANRTLSSISQVTEAMKQGADTTMEGSDFSSGPSGN